MLQVFRVSEICSESHYGGMTQRAGGWGVRRAWVLLIGCAHPHPDSQVSPARRERRGQGKRAADVGRGETDWDRVCVRGGTRQVGKDCSDMVGVRCVSTGLFGTV
jgi:hypothetical protein